MKRGIQAISVIAGAVALIAIGAGYTAWALSPLPERAELVPPDYLTARSRFLRHANAMPGAVVESFPIDARGPGGEPLSIDTLWIGNAQPRVAFLHLSGTHGVEGFAGSAIQSALLKEQITLPASAAVIFLHGLNPWGMAHQRRVNENNVDLNRNFVLDSSDFAGAPAAYGRIEPFLNPAQPPARLDLFFPHALYLIARYGFNDLKQAIGNGQYEFPRGLYYGGAAMQQSNKIFKGWAEERLGGIEKLYVVEVHTGLGERGKDLLFWQHSPEHEKTAEIKTAEMEALLGRTLDSDQPSEGVGFSTEGDLQKSVPMILPQTDVYWIVQEFGAYGPVQTLRALRNENAYHHYSSEPLSTDHWSKRELLEMFSPGDETWQREVIGRGVSLAEKFLTLLQAE